MRRKRYTLQAYDYSGREIPFTDRHEYEARRGLDAGHHDLVLIIAVMY